jgi:hypothetical protein
MAVISLDGLADLATIAGGIAVLLLLFQVFLAQRDGRVQLITGMTTMMLEVDKAFIEHPDMRPFFKDGAQPPETGTTHEQAHAIATSMANALDHVVAHLGSMKHDARRSWEKYIADLYQQSPVFADLLERHGEAWWPYLWNMIRECRISGRLGSCPSRRRVAAQSL